MRNVLYYSVTDLNNGKYLVKYWFDAGTTDIVEIYYTPVKTPKTAQEMLGGARKCISNQLVRKKVRHKKCHFVLTNPVVTEQKAEPAVQPAQSSEAVYSVEYIDTVGVWRIKKHIRPYLTETEAKTELFKVLNESKE